jgi:DNA adenine methylase
MARLVGLLPRHHTFISVFGGSGADILGKAPSLLEVYNDLDHDLFNLFSVLRDRKEADELIRRVRSTPYSRETFGEAKKLLRDPNSDRVSRAWATVACANQGHVGAHFSSPSHSWGYFVQPRGAPRWFRLCDTLDRVVRRFSRVILECSSWEKILDRYDSNSALFFVDPPYVISTRVGNKAQYRHELTEDDHGRLLRSIKTLSGGVMISGYDHPLYNDELRTWTRIVFDKVCSTSPKNEKPRRVEIVWTNCITQTKE